MSSNDLELVLVNIFHRHGERAPLKKYNKPLGRLESCSKTNSILETLPQKKSFFASLFTYNKQPLNFELIYKKIPTGECAPGQLTDIGKRRLFDFGRRLKETYINSGFLSEKFNPTEVHLTSTDFQRTIESLQSLVKGLFVGSDTNIPIHIGRRGINSPYSSQFCPDLMEERINHKEKVLLKHKSTIEKINEYVSKKYPILKNSRGPYEIFDIICSNLGNKSSYFSNFCPKMFRMAENFTIDLHFGLFDKTKNLINSKGAIIKDLYDRMHEVKDGKGEYKMYITSGHDVTIYPLLMALKIHDNKWPGFGANIIIETYKDKSDKFYVRVKHNEKVKALPDCSYNNKNQNKMCLLEDFLCVLKQYVPDDREKSCRVTLK